MQPSSSRSKCENDLRLCDVGVNNVRDILHYTLELFKYLEAVAPPNSTEVRNSWSEVADAKIKRLVRMIRNLFSCLRITYNKLSLSADIHKGATAEDLLLNMYLEDDDDDSDMIIPPYLFSETSEEPQPRNPVEDVQFLLNGLIEGIEDSDESLSDEEKEPFEQVCSTEDLVRYDELAKLCAERERLQEMVRLKNEHLKEIIDHLRRTICDINTMLAMRRS